MPPKEKAQETLLMTVAAGLIVGAGQTYAAGDPLTGTTLLVVGAVAFYLRQHVAEVRQLSRDITAGLTDEQVDAIADGVTEGTEQTASEVAGRIRTQLGRE